MNERTSRHPEGFTAEVIESLRVRSWNIEYHGERYGVRVFLAGDRFAGKKVEQPTVMLFGSDGKRAFALSLVEAAEAVRTTSPPNA